MPIYVDVSEQGALMSELRLLRRFALDSVQLSTRVSDEELHAHLMGLWREWDRTYGPTAKAEFRSMCKLCGKPVVS